MIRKLSGNNIQNLLSISLTVRFLGEIDFGAWSIVAKGVYDGQPVAVKLPYLSILNEHILEQLEEETQTMAQIRHPNLPKIVVAVFDYESCTFQASPMIVSEVFDMNLHQCYQQGKLQDSSRMPIFIDVAYGLHYLHDHQIPITHGNVSTPSVLLQALPAGQWKAKLSDFGSARLASHIKAAENERQFYTAPEALPRTDPSITLFPKSVKSDVFSYGILIGEVMNAQLPGPKHNLGKI